MAFPLVYTLGNANGSLNSGSGYTLQVLIRFALCGLFTAIPNAWHYAAYHLISIGKKINALGFGNGCSTMAIHSILEIIS